MQKENSFFFAFPSACNFGEARVTKKREKCKRKTRFSLHFRVPGVSLSKSEKLRRSQSYEKLSAKQKNLFFFCRDVVPYQYFFGTERALKYLKRL